ncbi:sigma-54-dependent Fis family transcriptional regulator [Actinomycetospora termitidis]|uniref:Helix-turn-helix domain-containing protein n=1 Tax=Actinomycetospora termitidis TaxID=3053470 RepID=A0ABT7M629_9PSEU|nr:helix-turn-helix domain-containing protein [Actinomycetospora sp. Odt1-22]MDL5156127.1 helix-turn-helix domain-containing protein [Actinomycetospora sp. Odt1-22]
MASTRSRVPALSSREHAQVRRSREALVGGGLLDVPPGTAGVPRVIEQSWRRCVGEQVPVAPARIDYREPEPSALRRAAEPVLDRLRWSLADVAVAMVLSDADGRIVARYADVRRQRTLMDRACAAEGFDYSEASIGTNGLGTVLVERRPVLVRGPEHYNAELESLTCAGTPIVEPYTGRVVGCFSLACATRDVHPIMTALAGDVGRQIEAGLLDQAGERRRGLVEAYLAVDRADGPSLVVDEDTVLANRAGLAHVGPDLHALLWTHLREHGRSGRMPVPLTDGFHDALVEPISDGGRPAFGVRLLPRPDDGSRRSPRPAPAVGKPLHHDPRVAGQLEEALAHGEPVAVVGPGGAGKCRTARALLRRRGMDPLVVEPALDPDWSATAGAAVAAGHGVVLRRVHEHPQPTVGQLQSLLVGPGPVALTLDLDAADDALVGTVRRLTTVVRLPTLAQGREHLPALVREIAPTARFSPDAWERLLAWSWPGNLAELHTTVAAAARRASGGLVEEDDLPEDLRGPRRPMGLLESAERDAVAEALRASGGNRTVAARSLGIGRNTLYRKMREFGLH